MNNRLDAAWRGTVFILSGISLATGALYAQCPVVTLTPTAWGSASGSMSFGGGTYTLGSTGTYGPNQPSENGFAGLFNWVGDGQIIARVSSQTGTTGPNSMEGVFIRKDATAASDGGFAWLQDKNGIHSDFATRTGGGNLTSPPFGPSPGIPFWLMLQDTQGVLIPATSPDGINWTQFPPQNLSSTLGTGTTLVFGLFAWSGNATQPMTVTFDNVCVSQVTPLPTFTPTSSPSPTGTPTPTFTVTPTASPTPSSSATATPSLTLTRTPTSSQTPTASATSSPTPTLTLTQTATSTVTSTSSPTLSPTTTTSPTPTSSPPPGVRVWPNPFTPDLPTNNRTHFPLPPGHGAVQLVIVDMKRREVRMSNFPPAGDVQWDGKDDSGSVVASGVYLYLLQSDGSVSRGTVTVLR